MKLKDPTMNWSAAGLAVALLAAASTARADYQSAVLAQNPVGFWRLNETVQPPPLPIDVVNIGTVGATGNGAFRNCTRGASGAIVGDPGNKAISMLSASLNGVRIPYAPQWNQTGPFTVEFWAKPGQTAGIGCPAASVEFIATPTAQRNGWLFYQGNSSLGNGNGWVFRQYNSTGLAAQTGAAVDMALDTTQWYHVVGVFDGTNIKVYVNGVPAASTPFTSQARANTNSSIPLTFGARADGASGGYEYNGSLDECAVYDVALGDARILAHYQAGTNATANTYRQVVLQDSPVGYWRLDEPGDPPAANLGTLTSAQGAYVYQAVPGAAGPQNPPYTGFAANNSGVSFSGSQGYVSIPPMNLNTNTVTITAWVKPNGPQPNNTAIVICSGGNTASTGLAMDTAGGLQLAYNWKGDAAATALPSSLYLADGAWNFVAIAVSPTVANLYMAAQTDPNSFASFQNPISHGAAAFDGPTQIGASQGTNNFNGVIDEVAIFTRTLTAGEIFTEYAAGVGGIKPQVFADPQAPADPVFTGDTVTLKVDAGGTPSLTYQWRKNSSPISGATANVLVLGPLTAGDAGSYDVVVSNGSGNVTSAAANIQVNLATMPNITQGPQGRTLYPGGRLNLSVVASGGGLKYQWLTNDVAIPDATNATFTVASVTPAFGGVYKVTVKNNLGTVVGGPVTVTIPNPAAGSYEAAVVADSPEGWWRLDDSDINGPMFDGMGRHDGYYTNTTTGGPVALGAAGLTRTTPALGLSDDGSVTVGGAVPFSDGLATTEFTLECWAKIPDAGANYCPVSFYSSTKAGEFVYFDAGAGAWRCAIGAGTDSYAFYYLGDVTGAQFVANKWTHIVMTYSAGGGLRWYVNGQWNSGVYGNFPRNPSNPLYIAGVGPGINYPFKGTVDEVAFYQHALSQAQVQAHFQAGLYGSNAVPVFTLQPVSVDSSLSNSVSFTGFAEGTAPLTYQWLKDGSPVSGATTTILTLTSALFADVGNYQLQASNSAGATLSATAHLTVAPKPAFANATNGLVLHLTFDGTLNDVSGRGNNGTAQGAPTFVAGRVGSQALHYNTDTSSGVYNYVSLGTPADLNFGSSTDFSVSYWVRLPAGSLSGDLPFLCSANNSYGGPGLTFAPSYKVGGWSFSLNGKVQTYGPDGSINDGNWHHLLHSVSRTGNAITYLDGLQVDSRAASSAGDLDTGNSFSIGQDPTGLYGETGSADLDDMAVWRRALTGSEAYAIYYVGQQGTSISTYGPVNLFLTKTTSGMILSWQAGTLLQAPSLNGPWTPVPSATAPNYTVAPSNSGNLFYRVQL